MTKPKMVPIPTSPVTFALKNPAMNIASDKESAHIPKYVIGDGEGLNDHNLKRDAVSPINLMLVNTFIEWQPYYFGI